MSSFSYKTGIEIWEGDPGAGKSYGVTEKLVRVVLKLRRPVYTNLPLRHRVLQKYLTIKAGSATAAKYIQRLNVDHFVAFLARNQAFTDWKEREQATGKRDSVIEAEFVRVHGVHKLTGKDANWFPPGSVFCLDELHRWFNQRFQDTEPPELLTYLTMHRHHLHWIICMTQNRMQLSIPWRQNCVRLVHCSDCSEIPFLWGIKFPIRAFRYVEYPKELISIHQRDIDPRWKHSDSYVRIPAINGGTIWRLYDSFTHMGNRRALERRLSQVQRDIEGPSYKEKVMPKRRGSLLWPFLAVSSLALSAGAFVFSSVRGGEAKAALPLASQSVGVSPAPRPPSASAVPPALPASRPSNEPLPGKSGSGVDPAVDPRYAIFPWRVAGASDAGVVVEGSFVEIGGYFNGFTLMGCSAQRGVCIWKMDGPDGTMVMLSVGGGVPRRLDAIRRDGPDSSTTRPTTRPTTRAVEGFPADWGNSRTAAGRGTGPQNELGD